jgi:hypothetical protein
MSDNNIYSAPSSEVESAENVTKPKASFLLKLIAILLAVIGGFLSGLFQFIQVGSIPFAVGGAIGGALFWPFVLVGLFQIGKRFRNQRSRYKIFLWTQVVVVIAMTFNIVLYVGKSFAQI